MRGGSRQATEPLAGRCDNEGASDLSDRTMLPPTARPTMRHSVPLPWRAPVRRIRTAVAILSITAFAVAGCSSGNSGSDTSTAQTTAPATSATSAGAGTGGGTGSDSSSAASSSAPQITSGQAAGAPASGGVYTIALANDPGNLDPSMTALSVTRFVSHLAYDTLLSYKTDGTAVSGLAKSWKVGPDNVVFTMVPDVTCSDGSKFTPTDAADNLNYVSDPANKSPLTGVFIDPGTKA